MIQPIAIEKYCDALKDRILFNRFNMETFIHGDALKNLTPSEQINSFVLREIFTRWQKEAEKLKSPYFDFEHPDIKAALKEFLNKLSFQIKINKDYFEVLLKEALHQSFEYLENPVYFLQTEIFDFKGNTLSNTEIIARAKFLKLYSIEVQSFLKNPKIMQSEVRLDILMKVIEDEFEHVNKIEEEKNFVNQISKLVPNNYINLTETKPAVEKVDKKRNFIDDLEFEGIEIELPQEIEIVEETAEVLLESLEELHESIEPEEIEIKESTPIIREIPKLEKDTVSQLAPIENFDDGISLQQKFYFIKELFEMDESAYQKAVLEANRILTFDEACNYLWDNFSDKNNWVEKEEVVTEFLSILNRKF